LSIPNISGYSYDVTNECPDNPVQKIRLLVVDDEEKMCYSLKELLEREGFLVDTALSVKSALALLGDWMYNLVICDVRMPEMGGISLLSKIGQDTPVIMITAYASIETARRVFKLGARDYLTKPFKFDELLVMVRQFISEKAPEPPLGLSGILLKSESEAYVKVLALAAKFSSTDLPILLTGESGTGKEIIADYIYGLCRGSAKSYVKINCAAIPEALLEGELFGYEKGAFTGALCSKAGKIEEADHGILFLDEVGDMPLILQAKMLRVLQDFKVYRLGSNTARSIDTRIIAASNQDLGALVEKGQFRLDLLHRLRGLHLVIPPLRERQSDIEDLSLFFLGIFSRKYHKDISRLADEVLELFRSYSWPGNIRELKYSIERAVVVCEDAELRLEHLPDSMQGLGRSGGQPAPAKAVPDLVPGPDIAKNYESLRQDYMRKVILDALAKTSGNKVEVARLLGISRKTLYNRMKELNIKHEFS